LIAGRAARWIYLALIALQPVWHGLLPPPAGNGNWALAVLATVPLLLPLRGVWSGTLRAMAWAGYLSMLYLVVGVMEAWANPPQRPRNARRRCCRLPWCAAWSAVFLSSAAHAARKRDCAGRLRGYSGPHEHVVVQ
jgi:hypothetical protein